MAVKGKAEERIINPRSDGFARAVWSALTAEASSMHPTFKAHLVG